MGRHAHDFDWITLLLLAALGMFGLFVLSTVQISVFLQQLLFLAVGVGLLFGLSYVDAAIWWWFAPIGYVCGLVFLALSYLGPSIRGATRWILIGPIQLQPSELAKPLFLLAFAYFISKYSPRKLQYLPLHLGLFLVPFLLVFKQPDLGSSLVYLSFFMAMMLAGGFSVLLFVLSIVVGGSFFPFLWSHLADFQQQRVLTFLNPALDPKGAGYNALQSMIAVGSGQLFGRGLGRGTQSNLRFLPEYHTDFIFATLVEELGFLGGALLFVLYGVLLARIITPFFARRDDDAVFIYAVGLFGMLLCQIFINAGMNMGVIPITGITLPFVSYGGSSILSTTISFGILWALRRKAPGGSVANPRLSW